MSISIEQAEYLIAALCEDNLDNIEIAVQILGDQEMERIMEIN